MSLVGGHKFSALDADHQSAVVLGMVKFFSARGTTLRPALLYDAFAAIDPLLQFNGGETSFFLPETFKQDLYKYFLLQGIMTHEVSPSMN